MINPNDITTIRVGQLPTAAINLTDVFPFEITDLTLKKATFQDLVNFINIHSAALQFEVKMLNVNQAYIDNNFDGTGLGINLCTGFARCNGQNGTANMDGRIGIGHGTVTSNIGGFGGEKEHILSASELPAHTHTNNGSSNDNGDPGQFVITSPNNGGGPTLVQSSTSGGGNAHNNMQPYIVQLYIMKL